jgi:hypothetical protein
MLARMQGKGKPYTLLVGMQNSLPSTEMSMEVPQKTKTRTNLYSYTTSCMLPRDQSYHITEITAHSCLSW